MGDTTVRGRCGPRHAKCERRRGWCGRCVFQAANDHRRPVPVLTYPPLRSASLWPLLAAPTASRRGLHVKFLHTSDWHAGKILKGRDRLAEQRDVLREIVEVARAHEVDAVLVAGDLYETSGPSAEAQLCALRTYRRTLKSYQ